MPDTVSAARIIAAAENAAEEAEALAERMREIGAWGAYAALQGLARKREARVERLHTMHLQATGRGAAVAARPGPNRAA